MIKNLIKIQMKFFISIAYLKGMALIQIQLLNMKYLNENTIIISRKIKLYI